MLPRLKFYILFVLMHIVFLLSAQKLQYEIVYRGIADNREYFSGYNTSETILGSGISALVAAPINDKHNFKAGVWYFYEYGTELFELKPQPIVYYTFFNSKWDFKMGAFPRDESYVLPQAMLSQRYGYFNPNIEGLFLKYKTDKANFSVFADWISRQDTFRREQFMAGLIGTQRTGNFLFEQYWYMFHNAKYIIPKSGVYIDDYTGALLLAGYDFSSLLPLDIFMVKVGALTSAFRNRGQGDEFDIKSSAYAEIKAEKNGLGVHATLKYGSKHAFSHGDNFYNNVKNYSRVKVYLTPFDTERVKGQLSWSFHFVDGELDHQQQFSLLYYWGSR
ncbi:MAG: hypothetical protein PF436_03645 [Prolixibacteraceae bacterium]|jgi:hypothetical protein|nr:hypothetical protein [Prolixibacteraceae bacterium]